MHRQFSTRSEDAGFTLIEVVVAMLVFAIIATGFLMTLTAGLVSTRDTRTRIVAANLASQQIDLLRSQDVFAVTNSTRDITLNGDTFHVRVHSTWATASGATASCDAAGSDALAYRQVTVEVTWDNMASSARPVYSDTSLAPSSKINDPSLGTVLVSVIDSAGVGVSGATVSLSPANGVAAVTTDSDGCAYLLKVPPASSYTVGISKTGYVNEQHLAGPTATVTVAAGSTSQASFAYDKAATFRLTYAGNVSGTVTLPTNLTTTAMSTYGNSQLPASTNANPKTFSLYPIPSGYSIVAGGYAPPAETASATCLAPDPGEWLETPTLIGKRPDAVAAAPGGSVSATVPMGVVTISSLLGAGNRYLTAVYVGGGAGDPGCGYPVAPSYTFDSGAIVSGSATIALPYGTWKIYRGGALGALVSQITSGILPLTPGAVTGTGAGMIVTLDPRVAP